MSTQGKRPEQLAGGPPAPPRLMDDPATSSLVRQDLINVAGAAPAYDAAAGLVALHAALGVGSQAAASAGAAHVAKLGLGVKLAVASGVGAIAIASAVLLTPAPRRELPAAPRRAPVVLTPQPIAPVAPVVAVEPAAREQAEPAQPAPASRAPRDPAAAEIAQLAQIKATVESAPGRALRLAEQGHRRFGEGYLHHEREGLAIVALHALGRRAEASTRARRYLARYPHSPMTDRIRMLATEGGGP